MYDTVTNPIPKSNLFATPADMDHLVMQLNSIGNKEEQRMAWLGAMMALNLAHDLVEREILSKEVFGQ
jgi:hypothetical protein